MKQYVVINNSLGMSKGKIARVCLMLGFLSDNGINLDDIKTWCTTGCRAYIKKTNNYSDIKTMLSKNNIAFFEHIDAGFTQVPKGSSCGLVFFTDKDLKFIEELKLV